MFEIQLNNLLPYIGNNIVIKHLDYLSNYNGNEFGILNGVYPLYDKDKNMFWQYTTDNNSTGQSLKYCLPLLKPLSDIVNMQIDSKIPIIECARLAGLDMKFENEYKFRIENNTVICERQKSTKTFIGFEIDLDDFGFDSYKITKTKNGEKTKYNVVSNPDLIIDYLYSKKFDVQNLIENKMALNINDFPQFKY